MVKNCESYNSSSKRGECGHIVSGFVSESSGDSSKNSSIRRKAKMLPFTKILVFTVLIWISQCYNNTTPNNTLGMNGNECQTLNLRTDRILATAEEVNMTSTNTEGQETEMIKEEITEEKNNEEETKEKKKADKSVGTCNCNRKPNECCLSINLDFDKISTKCICDTYKSGLKKADEFFEKNILTILDAGKKNIKENIYRNANVVNNILGYLKYVLLFSPLLLELLASKLLLAGHYKTSQLISTLCVTFYFYVFYKIVQNCGVYMENSIENLKDELKVNDEVSA
ncbi:Plasmodium exported protein, unknown function [Plasmodium ovale wallikeri]|uniref:Uncharacterized protein n=2 Tax=Plasmodium ovale TaxID=36330 RepID=A0A1A8Z6V6_PLAOA|nr:Plasmodium exported protein, unknown function [Plasmodium ovale wallikeri]SBT40093.1 Plasmodium exported protein, unknown function [Plasmodium ovale wallikeri]SBT77902.1 Plasmodium exported protein, unknown function [Plasmodium ovale]